MKHNLIIYAVMAGIIVSIPGCGRVVDWASDTFHQGDDVGLHAEVPREHTRSVTIYDQFSTHGKFDVMWLSDAVRTAYSRSHAQKYGLSKDRENALLRRQLEENRHFIVFYLLANYQATFGDKLANWALSLEVDDRIFAPVEIKEVDLVPEYKGFFGKKYNRFKTAYRVKFEAKDTDDIDILHEDVSRMVLRIASVKKEAELAWTIMHPSKDDSDLP